LRPPAAFEWWCDDVAGQTAGLCLPPLLVTKGADEVSVVVPARVVVDLGRDAQVAILTGVRTLPTALRTWPKLRSLEALMTTLLLITPPSTASTTAALRREVQRLVSGSGSASAAVLVRSKRLSSIDLPGIFASLSMARGLQIAALVLMARSTQTVAANGRGISV